MTKEHYDNLIQEVKNDKDFYVGQVVNLRGDELLIVKNSKAKKGFSLKVKIIGLVIS